MSAVIRQDMPDAEYRRHPALSFSGAKLLLPPGCPALYRWRMDNPEQHKPVFDFGKAAHREVLGKGQPVRYVDASSWQTKAARAERDEAYAAGEIPLLESDRGVIEGMVKALREHPLASRLFDPERGTPEVSLFWQDEDTGVDLRGRLDWLPLPRSGRFIVPDYKTTACAHPSRFAKSANDYGYPMQHVFYSDGVRACLDADDVSFLFVAQEKTPPYLVSVIELDAEAVRVGREKLARAIRIFKACTDTNTWPGFPAEVEQVSLPIYAVREHDEQQESA